MSAPGWRDSRRMRIVPENGFSLTDLIVGLALGLTVMALLVSFFVAEQRRLGDEFLHAVAQRELQAVMDLATEDLRTAGRRVPGLDYGSGDGAPGTCVDPGKALRLVGDLDGDGGTDGAHEDVTYCLCPPDAEGRRVLVRSYRPSAGSAMRDSPLLREVTAAGVDRLPRRARFTIEVTLETRGGTSTEGVVRDVALRNTAGVRLCNEAYVCPGEACS